MIITTKTRSLEKIKFRYFLLLFMIFSCLCGSPSLAAGCPKDAHFNRASVFHVTSPPVQVLYNHDLSTSQIEAMRNAHLSRAGLHNPGLTEAEEELHNNFEIRAFQNSKGGSICLWVDSVDLEFSYVKMDVYISSQYREGSCPYNAILAHEKQHVAINQRVLLKYKVLMGLALKMNRDIPTKANPLSVRSVENGKKLIQDRISRIVNPLYELFQREVRQENAKIDTRENYHRVQARCRDW